MGRPTKARAAAEAAPASTEAESTKPDAPSEDAGGVDPEFERAMSEPAGGSTRSIGPDDDPFAAAGFGSDPGGGNGAKSSDPWETAMGLPGLGRSTSPQQPDESHEPPQPGSTRSVSDEDLVRRGSVDVPDDTLVTVELWEWRNGAADKVGTFQNVLYSKCRDPYTWINWGGEWYYKITNPEQRKKLKAGFIKTRGPDAPRTWRPTFGGDDMTPEQLIQLLKNMNGVGQQQGVMGVPTGVHQNVEAGLRTDLGELKAEIRELRTKLDQSTADIAEARRQRDMASSKYDALKERYDDAKADFSAVKSELATLRANPPKGDGKPDWVYMLEATKREDPMKLTDLLAILDRNKDKFGPAEFLAMQNSVIDSVAKLQSAGGSATKGDWSGAVEKGLGIVEKRLGMAQTMQRIDQRGGQQPTERKQLPAAGGTAAAATPAASTSDPKERAKIALDETMKRLLDAIRSGKAAEAKDREEPQVVGEAVAASIVWAGKLGLAEEDESIFGFMQQIVADPHQAIGWFCQKEGIPADYGRRVADAVKASLTPQAKQESKAPAVASAQPPVQAAAQPAPAVLPPPSGAAAAAPPSPGLEVGDRKSQDAPVAVPPKGNGGSHVVGPDGVLTAGDGVQGGDNGNVPPKPAQDAPQPQPQPVQPA